MRLGNWISEVLVCADDNRIQSLSVRWNMLASLFYSIQSAILVLVLTRVSGLEIAGVFTLAYTFTQMIVPVGTFSVRNYQASDAKRRFSFEDYFSLRVLTIMLMVVCTVACAVIRGASAESVGVLFLLLIYRATEVFEDVYHGQMQLNGRLDVGAKIETVRIFLSSVVFVVIELVADDLLLATIGMVLVHLVLIVWLNVAVLQSFTECVFRFRTTHIRTLLVACLPLCLSEFLYNYLVNAPKYSLDSVISSETQALFSILFMPVFIINVFSVFVFKPLITDMGVMWTESRIGDLLKLVIKQLGMIIALSVVIVIGGVLVGLPVLGLLYGLELGVYRMMFGALLVFGGFAAIVSFVVALLTIMRKQIWTIVAYGVATIFALMYMDSFVARFGMWGATCMYGASIGLVMIIMSVVAGVSLARRNK